MPVVFLINRWVYKKSRQKTVKRTVHLYISFCPINNPKSWYLHVFVLRLLSNCLKLLEQTFMVQVFFCGKSTHLRTRNHQMFGIFAWQISSFSVSWLINELNNCCSSAHLYFATWWIKRQLQLGNFWREIIICTYTCAQA